VANEPVPIGVCEPLSGGPALSILARATILAFFAIGSFGAALAAPGGHPGRAGAAGLAGIAFGALFARFLYDYVPQRAWLDGSVLTTERAGQQRRCNLATAEMIKLGSTMPRMVPGYHDAVPMLRAQQDKGSKPVRLVLRGNDLHIIPAAELLLLAQAIESRPYLTRAPRRPASDSASSPHRRNHCRPWAGASEPIRRAHKQPSTRISTTRPTTPAGNNFT
jgi:hypothetical protein